MLVLRFLVQAASKFCEQRRSAASAISKSFLDPDKLPMRIMSGDNHDEVHMTTVRLYLYFFSFFFMRIKTTLNPAVKGVAFGV